MKRKGSSKTITPNTVPTNALTNPTLTLCLFLRAIVRKIATNVIPAAE